MAKKKAPERSGSLVLEFLKIVLSLTAILVFLMVCSWRMDYRQAYAYTLVNGIVLLATLFVLRDKPELLEEKAKPGPGMKERDKIYYIVGTPFYILTLLTGALDAGRFGWSGDISPYLSILFYLVYFFGQGVSLWAKLDNPFLSSTVRNPKEKGQKEIDSGPYRWIRHPGHFGEILFTLSAPVILGSWWAMIPAALSCIALVIRTKLEDDNLQKGLRGYRQYTEKVSYRLIPFIW